MQDLKDRFEFIYESSVSASYLVLKTGSEEKLEQFQIEMILNNPSAGILPLDMRQKDNSTCLYYNVTSKQTLSKLLKRKRLIRNEFIAILSNILAVILDCGNYLLQERCFLLDEDYIFINPATLEISLVYIPIASETDIIQALRSFIVRLIIDSANIDENTSDNFLQRIIAYVKTDRFNLVDLHKLLNELRYGCKSSNCMTQDWFDDDNVDNVPSSKKNDDGNVVENGFIIQKHIKNEKNRVNIPKSADSLNTNIISKGKETKPVFATKDLTEVVAASETASKHKTGPIVIAAVIQIIIALTLFFCWGTIKNFGDDAVTTGAIVGIAILGFDYFLFKVLFYKKGEAPVLKKASESVNKSAIETESECFNKTDNKANSKNGIFNQINGRGIPSGIKHEKKPDLISERVVPAKALPDLAAEMLSNRRLDETTHLGKASVKKSPYLRSIKANKQEDITITKPNFIIGRLKGQADYILENNAVGKMHAEIITHNSCYYVKDLNSKNGTFINEKRLDCNKEYEIMNNERITFANSSFLFIIPE